MPLIIGVPREIHPDERRVADAGQFEDLRRLQRAGGKHDIGMGVGRLQAIALAILHPDGAPAIESSAFLVEGGKVVREAGPMKFSPTVIAFVEDPDGYKIELIERASN